MVVFYFGIILLALPIGSLEADVMQEMPLTDDSVSRCQPLSAVVSRCQPLSAVVK